MSTLHVPSLTYTQLKKLDPCQESLREVTQKMGGARKWKRPVNAADAVVAGVSLWNLIWAASALALQDTEVDRRLRLWVADCAARVLYIFERERPFDDRPRKAIEAARAYARGEVDYSAKYATREAAWAAAREVGNTARNAARAAYWEAAGAAAGAARAAVWDAGVAAWDAEKAWQLEQLVARMSEQEPQDWPLPAKQEAMP